MYGMECPGCALRGRVTSLGSATRKWTPMSSEQEPPGSSVGDVLEYLSRLPLPEKPMVGLLQRVTDLVKTVMPGSCEASVTLLVRQHPSTVVATGQLAVDMDHGQ